MNIIEVNGLTKYYGSSPGILNVSFSVRKGEIFGFLGANGSGKTTTIRVLLSLLRPHAGQILLFGETLTSNAVGLREKIGYLPGEFSPYQQMTGIDFLKYINGFRSHPPVLRDKLIEALKLLPEDLNKKIKHLSQGTRQKLGIIFAFEHNTELVILDEPTLGLDPLIKVTFYQFISEFQQQGKTVFLSSHNLPEVEKICHRVAIIRKGTIVALESIDRLKEMRPRRMIIEFKEIFSEPPVIQNADFISQNGTQYSYLVTGDISTVIKELSHLPIYDIIFPEPNLEDIFRTFYSESGQ